MDFLSTAIYTFAKTILNITCKQKAGQKTLYLTFDDGPTPVVTDAVLDILRYYNAGATFFCLGKNGECHPDILARIAAQGHTIGNHAYTHVDGWKTTASDYIDNVLLCDRIVLSNLFRPPYGRIGPRQWQLLRTRYNIILWDVMSCDFAAWMTPQKCATRVMNKAKDGSIVVFHDTEKSAVNCLGALPLVLDYFQKKGFVFASLPAKFGNSENSCIAKTGIA